MNIVGQPILMRELSVRYIPALENTASRRLGREIQKPHARPSRYICHCHAFLERRDVRVQKVRETLLVLVMLEVEPGTGSVVATEHIRRAFLDAVLRHIRCGFPLPKDKSSCVQVEGNDILFPFSHQPVPIIAQSLYLFVVGFIQSKHILYPSFLPIYSAQYCSSVNAMQCVTVVQCHIWVLPRQGLDGDWPLSESYAYHNSVTFSFVGIFFSSLV
jgi:hypothetical protein